MLDGLSVVSNDDDQFKANPTVIKILGCGGGGSSAVKRLIEINATDVEFYVLNTDQQALHNHPAPNKIAIGQKLTGGRGAGGNPDIGEKAAIEDIERIREAVQGANMVVITAGMGGGTGTGSAPIAAQVAKEAGILTVAVVTTPFEFEGRVRMRRALEGIEKLRASVDSIIVIPNQQLIKTEGKNLTYDQSFIMADEVLCSGIQGITQLITKEGRPNLDFADITSVLKDQGETILGMGTAEGENRVVDAAQAAISNPMLADCQIDGATKLLVNITSNGQLTMGEVDEIINCIRASADKEVEVFYSCLKEPDMGEKISVTLIAAGFNKGFEDGTNLEAQSSVAAADRTLVDRDEFESILSGGRMPEKPVQDEVPSPSSVNKVSAINIDTMSLFGNEEEPEEEKDEPVMKKEVSSIDRIPEGYKIDPKDKTVPARWRQQLSSQINLSQLDVD